MGPAHTSVGGLFHCPHYLIIDRDRGGQKKVQLIKDEEVRTIPEDHSSHAKR